MPVAKCTVESMVFVSAKSMAGIIQAWREKMQEASSRVMGDKPSLMHQQVNKRRDNPAVQHVVFGV